AARLQHALHALRSVLLGGRRKWVWPAVSVALFIVVLIRTAWLTEDAFITFRTVDNFIAGYGLRWNVAERVQTYTHPLWMLLVAGAYAITREMYLTVLVVSMLMAVAGVVVIVTRVAPHPL